jgi:CRP-like cAMP-binding protein
MNTEKLKNYKIFEDLSNENINLFVDVLEEVSVGKGENFISEGDAGDSVFLLLKGDVEVNQVLTLSVNKGEIDRREKALIKLSSDDHPQFGEMSMFSEGDRRTANVQAKSDCTLAKIHKEDLFKICDNNPNVGYKIMRNLGRIISGNLVKANQNVLKLTTAFSLILER